MLALLIATLVVAAWAGTGGGWPFGEPQTVHAITVSPGQTMWSIATDLAGPEADVRPLIRQIERINDLDSATLWAGQRLLIPSD